MGKQMSSERRSRCVIVGSAPFVDADALAAYLRCDDFVVAADGGQRLVSAMGRTPDMLIGDFDSSALPEAIPDDCRVLPTKKDDTDVLAAIRASLELGYREFLLLGCLGGRFDHTLANVFLLRFLHDCGADGMLVDEYHEVSLLAAGHHVVPARDDRFLSLLPYGGDAVGVTVTGAEYPLCNATLDTAFPVGVSNAFCEKHAEISINHGFLLMILAKDV